VVAALLAAPAPTAAAAAAGDALPPVLRAQVTVTGPVVRLADLFDNAGAAGTAPVASTPPVNGRLILDAAALQGIARAHKLDWRPASSAERTLVRRSSVAVTTDELTGLLLDALAMRGVATDGAAVELAPSARQMQRPAVARLTVEQVSFDPASRRVSAMLAIDADDEPRQTLPLSARLIRSVAVPVLSRPLRPHDVIAPEDLTLVQVADRRLPANAVREADGVIGLTARRALAAGVPILVSDLQRAALVRRGELVLLVLTVPGMQLTARGRALADGGEGDVVRVTNESSRSIVEGIVLADGRISVMGAVHAAPR
jgi:flagella basal body P-ring formation protein FlgA